MIEVRRHLPSVAEYVALNRAVGWTVPCEEACERALAATVVSVGAFDGKQLVGMGRIIGDGVDNWVLVDIIVEPAHQRRGVGAAMISALEAEVAARKPGSTVLLFCSSRVAPFYERLGYEISPGTFMKKALAAGQAPAMVGHPAPAQEWGPDPPGRAGGGPTGPWPGAAPPRPRPPAIL